MRIPRVCLVLAFLGVASGVARANPIPCETLEAVRSGSDVLLTLQADKACYETAPDPGSVITLRDLFPVELEYTVYEGAESFTLSATDLDVSANSHQYELNYVAQEGYPSMATTAVGGHDCATLTGTQSDTLVELALLLDKSCFATPLPALEYAVKRNWTSFLLEWTETDQGDQVRCTTTDDAADTIYNIYEVGVRAGTETCYARVPLAPGPGRADAGVRDAAVQQDAGASSGDNDRGGCAAAGRSDGLVLLLLGVVLVGWRRRRS